MSPPVNDEFMSERIWKKLDELHDEVHKLTIAITEIKQWKKDQDEFDSDTESKSLSNRELAFAIIGALGMVAGIIIAFI